MAGQAPATPPPRFGTEYADRQAMQQRLEGALVASDLDRRSSLMRNIISNAPNIAALSGVGTVDQLANMFADAEAPIFNNAYGQQGDQLRRQTEIARLAAVNRSNRPKASSDGGSGKGVAVDPNRFGFVIPEGYPGAGQVMHFDNPEDAMRLSQTYGVDLKDHLVPPGYAGSHSIGTTGAGSANVPGQTVEVPAPPPATAPAQSFTEQNVTPTPAPTVAPQQSDPNIDMLMADPRVADAVPNSDGSYTVTLTDGSTTVLEF